MSMAHKNNLSTRPKVIAELGPGNSLGIGLAALISGAERYYAFDIARFATNEQNMEKFDILVELFRSHENIPGEDKFPRVKPYLDSYEFPHHIYDDAYLNEMLNPERIDRIRTSLANINSDDSFIKYEVPWDSRSIIKKNP
ncbi:MAG: hypothetical protein C4541_00455 [Candidatus Auribacter fodinae]|uniref:Uncharacterized protein n=1 Tax=Candidatus Auribacter fodinae TaxID=2093366 RepID=A0A3A4R6J6_9BACT|nr:MAG: hypothetical protein C4541_00455 [Candidatus Auribacter fodinae]